jgi:hypothetical protein
MPIPLSFRLSRITGSFLVLLLVIGTSGCNLGGGGNPTPQGTTFLYVSPTKNNVNDCLSPATACQMINTALSKAVDGDTIFVAPGTYPEQVKIGKNITITGTGSQPAAVVIDGQQQYQVLAAGCLACTKVISVSNLTIQNGSAPSTSNGGFTGAAGVTVDGATLIMSKVVIQNNMAGPGTMGIGGGVFIYGNAKLVISDSTITGNSTSNDKTYGDFYNGMGGGIYNAGTLNITDVTISNNTSQNNGGGLYNAKGGHANLSGAVIENNHSKSGGGTDGGGGIYSADALLLQGGTIKNNQAQNGGGLYSTGATTLNGVTIDGNTAVLSGGGIYQVYGQPTTRLTASNISIVNNQAGQGGGIDNNFGAGSGLVAALGYLQIEQSTIAHNHASETGGGIFNENQASMYLVNDTISNNDAAGVGGGIATGQNDANGLALNVTIAYNAAPQGAGIITGGGNFQLQNVLLAKNTNSNCSTGYGGTITSNAGNLSSDSTCNLNGPLDKNNLDPETGQLSDNGGTTQTIALETGSPAIDAGLQFLAPQIDQRGSPRGGDGNGDGIPGFDIGAFEVIPTTQGMSLQTTIVPVTATPSPYIFTITRDTDCRSGPGTDFLKMTTLPVGAAPGAFSRSEDSLWFQLYQPGEYLCWAMARDGNLSGDPAGLPVRRVNPNLIPTLTPTPVITFTPTPTPTPAPLTFTPNINAYCRFGPDRSFPSVDIALNGQPYLMDGRNLDSTWYRIMLSTNLGCWVLADSGEPSSDPSRLRVLLEVPTFTPTLVPSDIPTEVVNCSSFTSAVTCKAQPVCQWKPATTHPGDCVNK